MKRIMAFLTAVTTVAAMTVGCSLKKSSSSSKVKSSKTSTVNEVPDENGGETPEGGEAEPDADENGEGDTDATVEEGVTEANEENSEPDGGEETSGSDENGGEQEATQPDPLAPKPTEAETEGDEPAEETTVPEPTEPPDTNAYEQNGSGTITFSEPEDSVSDSTLIAAAQALYDTACETEWKFTVGCPYELDTEDTIETDIGWVFYRVDTEGITSLSDIEDQYYTVFSRRYPNHLDQLYIDGSDKVYALCGERGSDLYYKESRVTGVESKSDDEIFFKVESYYEGDDFEPGKQYTKTETFSAVIEEDGTWHAGKFTMPY